MTQVEDRSERTDLAAARRALLRKRLQGRGSKTPDDGIQPQPLDGATALSYTQQRIWFLQQLFPESTAYNMHETWRVAGHLDLARLARALNHVAAQQASLRTTFVAVDGQPTQQIAETVELQIACTDISHLAGAACEAELQRLALAAGCQHFDLGRGPLIDMAAACLGSKEHALLLTMHHIISDEWSIEIFWRELAAAYDSERKERKGLDGPALNALPIQYHDYALWQRTQVESGVWQRQEQFWQDQLPENPTLLQLPADHARPVTQTLRGGLCTQVLPATLWQAIQALAKQTGTTDFMLLLATFQLLLSRYSGQQAFLVGTPIANRQRPETKDVMGIFINTVVMPADLSGNPTFLQHLDRVRQSVLDALANQDLPFDRLVQANQAARDLSHNPLFQAMFVHQSGEVKPTLDGLDFERIAIDRGVSKFDLTLLTAEENGFLQITFEYSNDLFDAPTVKRFLGHWQTLLQAIVNDPTAAVTALPFLPEDERQLLLREWNEIAAPRPSPPCLHERISCHAHRHGEAVAFRCGEEHLTYQALDSSAETLARQLIASGATPGKLVGLYVERSLDMIVGILGILKAGCAYVPLEPDYPAERIADVVEDTQAPFIVTQTKLVSQLPRTDATILDLRDRGGAKTAPSSEPLPVVSLDDLAYVIFTSGSTGRPNGVMVTHGNLLASTLARSQVYAESVGRYLLLSSFAFDSSVAGIFWTLCDGGTLVLPAPSDEKDVRQLATLIQAEEVTHTLALPVLYRLLLTHAPDGALASLKTVIVAGEACPTDLPRRHFERLPACELYNEYGPTEATVWSTVHRLHPDRVDDSIPIGRPVPGYRLFILDEQGQPTPMGVPGELYVTGPGVTAGYWQNRTLTAQRFPDITVNDAAEGEDATPLRAYRTGDNVRWRADGEIEFLGRVDEQVKINGFRIEPGEIEAVLLAHKSVQDAAVLVEAQTEDGADNRARLVAYYVAVPAFNLDSLAAYLAQRLPNFLVPQVLVPMTALPRTPNGKLDRKQLPASPPPATSERPFVPPQTEAEKTLAAIWADILRLPQVSIEDKFFELGGDSIMSIQVIARAQEAGLRLTPRRFFQEQTIARLAAVAAPQAERTVAPSIESGDVPLTPIQHWFFDQQLNDPSHWNQAAWFETNTRLDPERLAAALRALINHHPMLRARFRRDEDGWRQWIEPDVGFADVEQIDLDPAQAHKWPAQIRAIADRLHSELHLSEGPLMRVALVDCGADQPKRLLIVIHHLVIDAVSWSIIAADLASAYRQLANGDTVTLPDVYTNYAQWAQTLADPAQQAAVQADVTYWDEATDAVPALPLDAETAEPRRRANTEGNSDVVTVSLDSEATGHLLREAHTAYNTNVLDLLLIALARTLRLWTGRDDTFLTLERHGREEIGPDLDLSRTVGWFTSLSPIRLRLTSPEDVGADLRAVKEQLRAVPHNGLSYGMLRYRGNDTMRQRMGAQPTPEILFNYLGRTDATVDDRSHLRMVAADIGQAYGVNNQRAHLIDINAAVIDDYLTVHWQYPSTYLNRTTVVTLTQRYITELVALIDHCLNVEDRRHTPSDFPLADLEQDDLDSLSDLLDGLA